MANPEHLEKLKKGVETWNKWRNENREIIPDLSDAKLNWSDLAVKLSRVNLSKADLSRTDLEGMNLIKAYLRGAHLTDANLSEADLREANLSWADLREANLSWADLSGTDFSWADLTGADLSQARLYNSLFWHSNIEKANFTGCRMGSTTFANVDLSKAKDLDAVEHGGPSTIGMDTIYLSKGKIPETFLRGAGIAENFITKMHLLTAEPYYSCFISYSSKDQGFAKFLHAGLQQEGVPCWFAPEDLKTGDKFRQRIDEAIRINDKLLVVLSKNSIKSSWVEEEVESALEREQRQNKLVLFPVRLDDAVMKTKLAWAASLRRTRHIADFVKWQEPEHYQTAFKRLLRDLQGEATKATSAGAP
ncbi:MAG TPA: toll/interleukin-1 receptor domain-containing protein [Candidatus Angelobacter sp.]|nr:toll/interleukin-1 receptor domain-containing protein [Candidatus Angelobacter sp.]